MIKELDELDIHDKKRYNVFRYFEEDNLLLPIVTTFDEEKYSIKADVSINGNYCVVDLDSLMNELGIFDEEQELSNSEDDLNVSLYSAKAYNNSLDSNVYIENQNSSMSISQSVPIFYASSNSQSKKNTLIPDWITVYGISKNGNQYALLDSVSGKN